MTCDRPFSFPVKGEMAIIFFPHELCMISIVAVNRDLFQNFLFYFLAPIPELSGVLGV